MPFAQPTCREIATHVAAWLGYLGFQVLAIDRFEHRYAENLGAALSQLSAQLIFTYTTLYWLIPAFLLKKERQYYSFWLLLAGGLAGCAIMYWQGTYYLFLSHNSPDKLAGENPWDISRIIQSAFYLLCSSCLLIAVYMIRYGFRQQQLNQQLVIANQTVELKSLKDQINPHFLSRSETGPDLGRLGYSGQQTVLARTPCGPKLPSGRATASARGPMLKPD